MDIELHVRVEKLNHGVPIGSAVVLDQERTTAVPTAMALCRMPLPWWRYIDRSIRVDLIDPDSR